MVDLDSHSEVVVLIDEYDKPVTSNDSISNSNNLEILKNFYQALKNMNKNIKLLFVTGKTSYCQRDMLSGANYINNMTLNPEYSQMFGFTKTEIENTFSDKLTEIAKDWSNKKFWSSKKYTVTDVINKLTEHYNGYNFSGHNESVLNPWSVLNFLRKK